MVFRRMVKHAADEGYDRIAWISGEETAKRYDLSKHIDNIKWYPKGQMSERGRLIAYKDGREIINKAMDDEDLPETIGKEAAEKLLKTPLREGGSRQTGISRAMFHYLPNADLKVGGGWARNLYDKALPEYAAKFGKKYGAVVEPTSFPTRRIGKLETKFQSMKLTPALIKEAREKGVPFFTAAPLVAQGEEE